MNELLISQIKNALQANGNDKLAADFMRIVNQLHRFECSGCNGEGLIGSMTQEGGEGEECPFCHGKTVDQLVDECKKNENDADLARSLSEHLGCGRDIKDWHLITNELDKVYQERDLYKTKDAQWRLKYEQTMDTWAAQSVDRDASESVMKRIIREYAAEKDQDGNNQKATEILAVIGEKYESKPI